MQITINIPESFREHWTRDRFRESLKRLREDAHCLAWNYERELADMLIEAFRTAKTGETETGKQEETVPEPHGDCDTCYFRGKERIDEPCWKCSSGPYAHCGDMYIQDTCIRKEHC